MIGRPATSSSWGTALAAVAVSRLLWLGVFIAVLAIDFPGVPLLTGLHDHLVSWDAISFMSIATHGYPGHLDYRDAFLPGFPIVVRAMMLVTRDDVIASWLVNAVAETVALWYLGRLVLGERDRSAANFSVWLIALAPTALFLIAPFSESTFIASAAASLYYARAGQSRKAIIAAALACAFRLTGLALIPALALEQLRRTGWRPRPEMLLVLLAALPLVLYSLYMQIHIGDALALLHADHLPSFGLQPTPPWTGFATTWHTLISTTNGGDSLDLRPRDRLRPARPLPLRRYVDVVTDPPVAGSVLHHRLVDDRVAAVLALPAPLQPRAVPGGAARL